MNILIVKTSAIGDVTHTLPALNALRKRFPFARIDWLVEEASADIVSGCRALDSVVVCRRKSWIESLRGPEAFRTAKEIFRFVSALRSRRYDLIVDFQGLLKSAVWVFLAKGKRKVGFGPGMEHAEHSHIFYNERVPAVCMEIHAVDRGMMLLSAIGACNGQIAFDFPLGPNDRREADRLLEENRVASTDRIAVVNPMARWKTKLWDERRFAETADRIARMGFAVCFTGSADDSVHVARIVSAMKAPAADLTGKTSLKSLAALYERAEFLLTTDTGPMHIAAALGTPVVALFGPTAPWRTGPYGKGNAVVRVQTPCGPCFRKECADMRCMRGIDSDMVMEKVRGILEKDC